MRKRLLLGFILTALGIVAFLNNGVVASQSEVDTEVQFFLSSNDTVLVRQKIEIRKQSERELLSVFRFNSLTDQFTNLSIRAGDQELPFSLQKSQRNFRGLSYPYQTVRVDLDQLLSQDQDIELEIEYLATNLVRRFGDNFELYIPPLEDPEINLIKTSFDYPVDWQVPTNLGAKISPLEIIDQRQFYQVEAFDQDPLVIQFGDSVIYNLTLNLDLNNPTDQSREYQVLLPPNTNNQEVYVNSINPLPENTYLDGDDNIVAIYKLNPGQDIRVTSDINLAVNQEKFNLTSDTSLEDLPANITSKYLESSEYWPSKDPAFLIQTNAIEIPDQSITGIIGSVQDYMRSNHQYSPIKRIDQFRAPVVETISSDVELSSLEYQDLMLTILRRFGVPTRMEFGYAYSDKLKLTDKITDSQHFWLEVYMPDLGWVPLDTIWYQKYNNFGLADIDHIALSSFGLSDQVDVVKGNEGFDGYSLSEIKVLTDVEISNAVAGIELDQRLIFPGLSWYSLTIRAPLNQIGNNYIVNMPGLQKQIKIDSLAPAQNYQVRFIDWGLDGLDQQVVLLQRSADKVYDIGRSIGIVHWQYSLISLGVVLAIIASALFLKHLFSINNDAYSLDKVRQDLADLDLIDYDALSKIKPHQSNVKSPFDYLKKINLVKPASKLEHHNEESNKIHEVVDSIGQPKILTEVDPEGLGDQSPKLVPYPKSSTRLSQQAAQDKSRVGINKANHRSKNSSDTIARVNNSTNNTRRTIKSTRPKPLSSQIKTGKRQI
ncbi:hypothetical protein KA531_01750 [Candidatus Saccharibacteria bacterium]|nr:hypothetical protein [Candidatus Saccharibacteria bacterium]